MTMPNVPAETSFELSARERQALVFAYVAGRAAGVVSVSGPLASLARSISGRDLEPLAALLAGVAAGRPSDAVEGLSRLRFKTPAARRQAAALTDRLAALPPSRTRRSQP